MRPVRWRRIVVDHLHQPGGWLSPGHLEIGDDGRILGIGAARPGGWPDDEVLHLRGFGVPGVPNVHSHAFQRALVGRAEQNAPGREDSFWTWRTGMYALAEALRPEDVQAVAAWLYVEMLEAGTTSVGEFHYLHHDAGGRPYSDPAELSLRVLAAADQAGIALTHLPVLYQQGGFGREPEPHQRRFVHARVEDFLTLIARVRAETRSRPRVCVGMAPHSLRAVSGPALAEVLQGFGHGPVHIHIAEQEAEVEACLSHRGRRPVAWLLDEHPVDARWTLVHATHVDATERARMAERGCVAGLCPTTEANLGDGLFPTAEYLAEGGTFGVGSDSQVAVRPTEELRLLEYEARLARRRRNVLGPRTAAGAGGAQTGPAAPDRAPSTGRFLFDAAVEGGARSLGQPAGLLRVGARADLVVLDPDHPRLVGHEPDTALDAWIFGGADAAVRDVFVGGERLVVEGRHVSREPLRAAFVAAMGRLVQAL